MTFEKGLAVVEVNDTETKGFYIDQEALEFARMNARTEKHRKEAENDHKKATRSQSKAEKVKAERKAYTLRTVRDVLISCAICGGAAWAGKAGLIHPTIFIPVSIFCLCAACVRFGVWYGKAVKK